MRLGIAILLAGVATFGSPAFAQNQGTPEQRIDRLERQLRQVQGRVFVRGQPADTAGLAYDPAATQSSVSAINDRLIGLERQMADLVRQSEENGHRLSTLEGNLRSLSSDQNQRISALESRVAAGPVVAPAADAPVSAASTPQPERPAASSGTTPRPTSTSASAASAPTASTPEDPGEDAYSEGFHLWEDGKYREAITALRSFTSAYPKHRRLSWANNLIGRSLLDSGQPRAAAEALLANYRSNPKGERAPDSLFYLGQSLMKLGQPAQACKAYAELEDVYSGKIRAELSKLLPPAKAQAGCS